MITNDPQFLYMILVLPSLFGLTLLGEGLNKLVHEELGSGIISIIFAFMFLAAVVFMYIFFSSYVTTHKV